MKDFNPKSGVLFCAFALAAAASLLFVQAARADSSADKSVDEFSVVAPGDASYAQLSALAKAGWLDAASVKTPTQSSALTRYEISLQVARAIFAVAAHAEAEAIWTRSAPKPAARALRELSGTFRGELKSLGVDVAGAQKQLDAILKNAPAKPQVVATRAPQVSPARASAINRGLLSVSQRLRVDSAADSLMRDAGDLFGDAAFEAAGGAAHTGIAGEVSGRTGMALGVTNWLTLRAGYASRGASAQTLPSLTANSATFATPFGTRESGGGVNVSLPRGVTLSGDLANVSGLQNGAPSWTQLSGGVGWSGWSNRLSMKANLSRLVPGDARILPSTLVGVNVGLDVSERLSLSLRYQQMFSAPQAAESDRLVAGGVSLNF